MVHVFRLQNNNILIELERMNSILDFDEKLGYITVEPGVTFNQAFNFLRAKTIGINYKHYWR